MAARVTSILVENANSNMRLLANTHTFQTWGSNAITDISLNNVGNSNNNFTVMTISRGYVDVQGQIYASDDITAFSDIKFKADLEPIPNALERLQKVRGYTFTRTDADADLQKKRYMGVIAQEVQDVFPEIVYNKEGTLSVAYQNMAAVFIESLREVHERLVSLERKVEELSLSHA